MTSATEKKVPVNIDQDLFNMISKSISGKGFSTVDDFVNYVLRIAIGKDQGELSEEDTSAITDRLKALGYI